MVEFTVQNSNAPLALVKDSGLCTEQTFFSDSKRGLRYEPVHCS